MSAKINFLMYQSDQKHWFHPKSFVPQSCPSTSKFKHRREVLFSKEKKRVKFTRAEETMITQAQEEVPQKATS